MKQTENDATLNFVSAARLKTIFKKSKKRKDSLHKTINGLSVDEKEKLTYHRACVSTYTSDTHIKRAASKKASDINEPPIKRKRRSDSREFKWKEHCLFCGEGCEVEKDEKHPERWRPASVCSGVLRGLDASPHHTDPPFR